MARPLFLLVCFCVTIVADLQAQSLRESPKEDTLYHFYALDSALLALYYTEHTNRDSIIFLRHQPVRIGKSKLAQVESLLPQGSYLRVHASDLFVEKEIIVFQSFTFNYVADGEQLIFFIKDIKTNILRKDLHLYYQGKAITFDQGKGAYIIPWEDSEGKDQLLLIRDQHADYAYTLTITPHNQYNYESPFKGPDIQPAAGYMLLSKPKYKPGDTLKAYTYQITGKNGRPIRKKISVSLSDNSRTYWQQKIRRQKPGSYQVNYPIPDSLLLDRNYMLFFNYRKNGRSHGLSGNFTYEDYNLDKATYDFFLDETQYKAGDSLVYYISAKDENGFAQPFGQYTIDVHIKNVSFIRKDTFGMNIWKPLYHTSANLSGEGLETHTLPSLPFPPGKSQLMMTFRLVNELNEEKVFTREFEYDNTPFEFSFRQNGDSILADYLYLRKSTAKRLRYFVTNQYGDTIRRDWLTTPASIPVRLDYNLVQFFGDSTLLYSMQIEHSLASQINLQARQSKDSVWISFLSGSDRTVYYTILKNGKVLLSDSGLSLNFRANAGRSDRYEFTLSRETATGTNADYNHWYLLPERKKLALSNNLPDKILPGATLDMTVSVRDYEGKPRRNIDLSSYAIKNQFKEENGTHRFYFLPAHKDTLFAQVAAPSFSINHSPFGYSSRTPLTTEMISKMDLHKIPYYQFYFPPNAFFEEDMGLQVPDMKDATAQLSVQLVQNGRISSPVWIKADGHPIYYALTTKRNVAALPAGKHHIQFQVGDKILDLGTLEFQPGKKKILSVNMDSLATRSRYLVAKDSVFALQLDSLTVKSILDHSYVSFSLPARESQLVSGSMKLYYNSQDFNNAPTGFLGSYYQFFGPYYNTRARMLNSSDSFELAIGSHNIHFFDREGRMIKTLAVPKVQWPAIANLLSFNQVFDSLYYPPVAATPYQHTYVDNQPVAPAKPAIIPLFGDYTPQGSADSLVRYIVFDPAHRIMSLAVVRRDDIEQSWFKACNSGMTQYGYSLPRAGNADLFFQLSDGSCIRYKNISFQSATHFFVNTDSLKPDTADKSDLVFYQNVYSSLTSQFKQLFTNYPERVSITFERSQKGRKSSMILGRLLGDQYSIEDIYLENAGRFVAGTTTDENGNFQFLDVSPGNYMIKIHPASQKPIYVYNLDLRQGDQYSLAIQVLEEEHPILLAAINPHFELLVRETEATGTINLYERDQKDLLTNGKITFIHESDTLLRITPTNNRFVFPVGQWPAGLPVSILVTVPGYESLWVKHFPAQEEFQYRWKFFLQKKISPEGKENSLFINGSEIARYIPGYAIDIVPEDSVFKYNAGAFPTLRLSFQPENKDTTVMLVRVYKENRLYKSYSSTPGALKNLDIRLEQGSFTIDISSGAHNRQRITLSVQGNVRYEAHLPLFYARKRIASVQSVPEPQPAPQDERTVTMSARKSFTTGAELKRAPPQNTIDMVSLSAVSYQASAPLQIGGARAEGTVYMIEGQVSLGVMDIQDKIEKGKAPEAPTRAEAEAMKANPLMQKLRNTFSDEAAYIPGVRTDREGNAHFRVHFPDDITLWDMHQVALGRGYFFGQDVTQLRAFKPVTGSIRTPRYLYTGDSLELGYSFRNLLDETKSATWLAKVNEQTLIDRKGTLIKGIQDSAYFKADSLHTLEFYTQITTADSFIDQELRTIPVKEKAILSHSDTSFVVQDTGFTIFRQPGEMVKVRIAHTLAEYLGLIATQLESYPYSCLEQKCSRLKGLIYLEKMVKQTGQPFGKQRLVRNIITEIEKSQNSDGSFAWWRGPGDIEMTQIALEALQAAQNAGYIEKASSMARFNLSNKISQAQPDQLIDILGTLLITNNDIRSYRNQFDQIYIGQFSSTFDELQYLRIKAYYTDSFERSKIWSLMQRLDQQTVLPYTSIRFTRESHALLLRAFRLFKGTPLEKEMGKYMKQYIAESKHTQARNTYEQSLVMENFWDFTLSKERKTKSHYRINSGKQQRDFPMQLDVVDSATHIQYQGTNAWATVDRIRNQYNPANKDTFFSIKSYIDATGSPEHLSRLNIKEDYRLNVSVFNYLPYEHVMITVPLPAGISLKHKIQYHAGIEHIEYYNDRIILYCSSLPAGQHNFLLPVRASFRGYCTWPPVRAELMYRPEIYGHNTFRNLEIR